MEIKTKGKLSKIFRQSILSALILGASYTNVFAESINGTATAEVLQSISITENAAMNFGNIAASASSGGTVTVDTSGNRTSTGDADLLGGTVSQGIFTISGEASTPISISYTNGDLDDGPGGGASMPLNVETVGNTASENLDGTGSYTLNVAGELTVNADQDSGSYSTANGSPYIITVSY